MRRLAFNGYSAGAWASHRQPGGRHGLDPAACEALACHRSASAMTRIARLEQADGKGVDWMKKVCDKQYGK
jgi:hypothetical protein